MITPGSVNPILMAGPEGIPTLPNNPRSLTFVGDNWTLTRHAAGNRKTFTFSAWVKRHDLRQGMIFGGGNYWPGVRHDVSIFWLNADGSLRFSTYRWRGGEMLHNQVTTVVFNETSEWHHVVLAVDSTNATDSERVKIYADGKRLSFTTNSPVMPHNFDTTVFSPDYEMYVHNAGGLGGEICSMSMAEVYVIEGLQLTPDSFSAFDGKERRPIRYSGSFGAKGYYLNFSNAANIGEDTSGLGNHARVDNFDLTNAFMRTQDYPVDAKDSAGALLSNYGRLNSKQSTGNLSNAATLANWNRGQGDGPTQGDLTFNKGKIFFECLHGRDPARAGTMVAGVINTDTKAPYIYSRWNGTFYDNGAVKNTVTGSQAVSCYIGYAIDCDAKTMTIYLDGVLAGTMTGLNTSNLRYYVQSDGSDCARSARLNSGEVPFQHPIPAGFKPLCTASLRS